MAVREKQVWESDVMPDHDWDERCDDADCYFCRMNDYRAALLAIQDKCERGKPIVRGDFAVLRRWSADGGGHTQ